METATCRMPTPTHRLTTVHPTKNKNLHQNHQSPTQTRDRSPTYPAYARLQPSPDLQTSTSDMWSQWASISYESWGPRPCPWPPPWRHPTPQRPWYARFPVAERPVGIYPSFCAVFDKEFSERHRNGRRAQKWGPYPQHEHQPAHRQSSRQPRPCPTAGTLARKPRSRLPCDAQQHRRHAPRATGRAPPYRQMTARTHARMRAHTHTRARTPPRTVASPLAPVPLPSLFGLHWSRCRADPERWLRASP